MYSTGWHDLRDESQNGLVCDERLRQRSGFTLLGTRKAAVAVAAGVVLSSACQAWLAHCMPTCQQFGQSSIAVITL